MTKEVMQQALEALENHEGNYKLGNAGCDRQEAAITAIKKALAQPEQEPVLQEIEQYRMQMAGISTAAIGYWKVGDGIHPDYTTIALHDVAKLYAKYDELYKAKEALAQPPLPVQKPVTCRFCHDKKGCWAWQCDSCGEIDDVQQPAPQRPWVGLTEFQFAEIYNKWNDTNGSTPWGLNQALEAKLRKLNT